MHACMPGAPPPAYLWLFLVVHVRRLCACWALCVFKRRLLCGDVCLRHGMIPWGPGRWMHDAPWNVHASSGLIMKYTSGENLTSSLLTHQAGDRTSVMMKGVCAGGGAW